MENEHDLLTRLRWFVTNVQSDSPVIPPMQRLAGEAADEIARLREELGYIAKQNLSTEMDEQANADADFEGGYDRIIEIARKAIQPI